MKHTSFYLFIKFDAPPPSRRLSLRMADAPPSTAPPPAADPRPPRAPPTLRLPLVTLTPGPVTGQWHPPLQSQRL